MSFGLSALLAVEWPSEPAEVIAAELRDRGVAVPDDWRSLYHAEHVENPQGAAVPEPAHVSAALSAAGVEAPGNAPRRAVVAAFDPSVETRPGAERAVAAAGERGPVGLLANVTTPESLRRAVIRSELDRDAFDAVCSAAGCGWRKPDPRAFESLARRLGVEPTQLTHVGRESAGAGVRDAGGAFLDLRETTLGAVADRFGP